jgi:hypothetical protein
MLKNTENKFTFRDFSALLRRIKKQIYPKEEKITFEEFSAYIYPK